MYPKPKSKSIQYTMIAFKNNKNNNMKENTNKATLKLKLNSINIYTIILMQFCLNPSNLQSTKQD